MVQYRTNSHVSMAKDDTMTAFSMMQLTIHHLVLYLCKLSVVL